jgi:hypothetical protein
MIYFVLRITAAFTDVRGPFCSALTVTSGGNENNIFSKVAWKHKQIKSVSSLGANSNSSIVR